VISIFCTEPTTLSDNVRRLFDDRNFAVLSTLKADGRPHPPEPPPDPLPGAEPTIGPNAGLDWLETSRANLRATILGEQDD
jgi:hypothetical protein